MANKPKTTKKDKAMPVKAPRKGRGGSKKRK